MGTRLQLHGNETPVAWERGYSCMGTRLQLHGNETPVAWERGSSYLQFIHSMLGVNDSQPLLARHSFLQPFSTLDVPQVEKKNQQQKISVF